MLSPESVAPCAEQAVPQKAAPHSASHNAWLRQSQSAMRRFQTRGRTTLSRGQTTPRQRHPPRRNHCRYGRTGNNK